MREYGIKATYSNICWFRNKDFEIVGGQKYTRYNETITFKVENEIVSLVKDYNEVRHLVLA